MPTNRKLIQFHRQEEATARALRGCAVVVIDVLRASSAMTTALAHGAMEAHCFGGVRETFRARRKCDDEKTLLCGERGGLPVKGFDLGNSPGAFTRERCEGKSILLTTTNGTRALGLTGEAREVVVGCFLNRSAVAAYLMRSNGDVAFLCAGTEGDISEEDVSCAGAIASEIAFAGAFELTEKAREAVGVWRKSRRSLRKFLMESRGGRPLVRLGLGRDVMFCARSNIFPIVPALVDGGNGFRFVGKRVQLQ